MMPFCTSCGKQIEEGNAFCTGCGAPANRQAGVGDKAPMSGGQPQYAPTGQMPFGTPMDTSGAPQPAPMQEQQAVPPQYDTSAQGGGAPPMQNGIAQGAPTNGQPQQPPYGAGQRMQGAYPPPAQPAMPSPNMQAKKPSVWAPIISFGVTAILLLTSLDNLDRMWYLFVIFIIGDIASLIGYFNQKKNYENMLNTASYVDHANASMQGAGTMEAPAMVRVIREKSFVGSVISYQIYANGVYMGEVKNGAQLEFPTQQALNRISVLDSYGNPFKEEAVLELRPNGRAEVYVKGGKLLSDRTRVY